MFILAWNGAGRNEFEIFSVYTYMAKRIRVYLWFTSFNSGDHCNTISYNASDIAREMTEQMEENLGPVDIEGNTKAERMLNIFNRINKLKDKFGKSDTYFGFQDTSWSTITLMDKQSVENVKRILSEAKQIKKKSRILK